MPVEGAANPVVPIPQCEWLVKKGEEPDLVGRSNMHAWTPALAKFPDKYEPYVGPVPMADKPANLPLPVAIPMPSEEDLREAVLFDCFETLDQGDLTAMGYPRVPVVKRLTKLDVGMDEVVDAWKKWKISKRG